MIISENFFLEVAPTHDKTTRIIWDINAQSAHEDTHKTAENRERFRLPFKLFRLDGFLLTTAQRENAVLNVDDPSKSALRDLRLAGNLSTANFSSSFFSLVR